MKTLIELLDAFEEGIAKGTLRKRSEIVNSLQSIENQTTTIANTGGLPPGTKSLALRIKQLAADIRKGLQEKELDAKEFRSIVRDKLGKLNTAFKLNTAGKLSASNKDEVRQHEAAPDTEAEIEELMQLHSFDQGVIRGKETWYGSQLNDAIYEMLSRMSLAELRGIDRHAFEAITADDLIEGMKHGYAHIVRNLLHKSDDEFKALSESYKHLKRLLPTHVDVAKAIRYPVVPLFNDIDAVKNPRKLENAGLDVTRVGDHFIVLENQFLLCFNVEAMGFQQVLKKARDGSTRSVRNLAQEDVTAVNDFIEQVNQRSHVKYVLASNTFVRSPTNNKLALVWIIPEKVRLVLEQTLRTRRVDWDIPRHDLGHG